MREGYENLLIQSLSKEQLVAVGWGWFLRKRNRQPRDHPHPTTP